MSESSYTDLIELDLDDERLSGTTDDGQLSALEWVILTLTNTVWGLVGAVLWLPLVVRTVFLACLGTIHGAVTRQPTFSAERIRAVRSFYSNGFLRRGALQADGSSAYRQRELRLVRLLFELGWAALFYVVVLRLFGWIEFSVAEVVADLIHRSAEPIARVQGAITSLWARMPESWRLTAAGDGALLGAAGLAAAVLFAAGWWLGRRRPSRRRRV